MSTLEFVGQSARDDDARMAQSSRLVNFYREPIAAGGQAQFLLKSVLGMNADFCQPSDGQIYAMHVLGGALFVVTGDALYSVSALGGVTNLGSVTVGNDCTIASNDNKITVAGNGNYYVWNGSTLSQPSATRLTSFNSLAFLGNYTILTGPNTTSGRGDEFQWSDLADPTTLNALNFNTADGRDGAITRCAAVNGVLFLFKERSHEVWQLTGQANANAFSRLSGGIRDVGLKSYRLFSNVPDGAFFVDQEGVARVIQGIDTIPISTPAVQTSIKTADPESCFYYSDEGHRFLVIRFRDRPAWVFDLDVGEWHERAEGVTFKNWTAKCSAYFEGAWRLGMQSGVIKTLSRSNADGAAPLKRTAVSRTLYSEDARLSVSELQFRGTFGKESLGRDAEIQLRVSRDNGISYGQVKTRSIGDLGDYNARCIFRRLGQARSFTAEVSIADPVDVSLLADARVEVSR